MIDERNWRSRLESNSAPVVATKMEKENFSAGRVLEEEPEPTKALYYDLEKKIASLGHDVRVEPRKWFVYLAAKKNFGVIKIQKSKLVVYLMLYGASLDDHEKRARPYHWNNSDYQVNVRPGDDLDYIAKLANQGYTNSSRTPGKLWS